MAELITLGKEERSPSMYTGRCKEDTEHRWLRFLSAVLQFKAAVVRK